MRKLTLLFAALALMVLAMLPVQAQGTIADIAGSTDQFSTLAAAVAAADPAVAEALSGAGPLTVFAPTNQAFANFASFLGTDLDALLADQALLTQLLLYHVIEGRVFSTTAIDVANSDSPTVPTLLEGTAIGLSVNANGQLVVNGVAVVVEPFDVPASNGVVHAIDEVIFPGLLRDRLTALADGAAAEADSEGEEVAAPVANVRIAHLIPGQRGVSLWVNGEEVATGVLFGNASVFAEVAPGTAEIAVTPAGLQPTVETTNADGETEVINNTLVGTSVDIVQNSSVTVAAIGGPDVLVIREDFRELPEGEARVTILHTIPDAPAIDVTAGLVPLTSGLGFGDNVSLTVAAGTYDIAGVLTVAGQDLNVIDLPGTELAANTYYLVAAIGTLANPDVAVIATAGASEEAAAEEAATEEATEETEAAEEAAEAPAESIAEVVQGSEDFSILLELVLAADPAVLETLSGDGEFTVFTPTNAAFEALFEELGLAASDVITLGGAPLITPVLLNHVVAGAVPAEAVLELDGDNVATLLEGSEITIDITPDGAVTVLDATGAPSTVIMPDVMASNGVIHVVDAVILPQVTIETLSELNLLGDS